MAQADFVPATDAQICTLGLLHIGENIPIDQIGEDSPAGRAAERFYAQTVGEVLVDYRWPFAKRISTPTPLDETTLDSRVVPDLWAFAYPYPANCVQFHGVYPFTRNPTPEQKIENDLVNDPGLGRLIVTDVDEPIFIFTARIEDTAQYSPTFVEALSWKLAVKFALTIRKDRAMAKDCMSAYVEAMGRAFASSAREVYVREPMSSHIRARG